MFYVVGDGTERHFVALDTVDLPFLLAYAYICDLHGQIEGQQVNLKKSELGTRSMVAAEPAKKNRLADSMSSLLQQ